MTGPLERLARLIGDWWRVDRVRISPREGRLLRLRPGDLLQLEGVTMTVMERRVEPDATGVRYRCEGSGFTGELWVGLDTGRQADEVVWLRDGFQRRLPICAVEVYSAYG